MASDGLIRNLLAGLGRPDHSTRHTWTRRSPSETTRGRPGGADRAVGNDGCETIAVGRFERTCRCFAWPDARSTRPTFVFDTPRRASAVGSRLRPSSPGARYRAVDRYHAGGHSTAVAPVTAGRRRAARSLVRLMKRPIKAGDALLTPRAVDQNLLQAFVNDGGGTAMIETIEDCGGFEKLSRESGTPCSRTARRIAFS